MERQNYKVLVANKAAAKIYRKVLIAIGENVAPNSYYDYSKSNEWLLFNPKKEWLCGAENSYENRQIITFKGLLKLIVNEEPKKIAVKVENEMERDAVNKFIGSKFLVIANKYPLYICLDDSGFHDKESDVKKYEEDVISFQDFAKQHDIKLPLLKSENGVWLFDGDYYVCAKNLHNNGWEICFEQTLGAHHFVITDSEVCKAFSTKQSALEWIEKANKPKSTQVTIGKLSALITKEKVKLTVEPITVTISTTDLDRIWNEYQEFKSQK